VRGVTGHHIHLKIRVSRLIEKSDTYRVALKQLKYDLEVICSICIDDLTDIRLLLNKVGKRIALDYRCLNLGATERGECG
jgi:hypothetical protein